MPSVAADGTEAIATPPGLRERKKTELREQLTEIAFKHFAERGFDATTVDELAAEAGVSSRTFFRYFASKEDVVLAWLLRFGDSLCAALARRPADEPPWRALHAVMREAVALYTADKARAVKLLSLLHDTPALRARHHEKQDAWVEGLSAEIARRLGCDRRRDLRPRLIATVGLGALAVAIDAWVALGGRGDLPAMIDDAFACAQGGLGAHAAKAMKKRVTKRG